MFYTDVNVSKRNNIDISLSILKEAYKTGNREMLFLNIQQSYFNSSIFSPRPRERGKSGNFQCMFETYQVTSDDVGIWKKGNILLSIPEKILNQICHSLNEAPTQDVNDGKLVGKTHGLLIFEYSHVDELQEEYFQAELDNLAIAVASSTTGISIQFEKGGKFYPEPKKS